ncbi:DUF2277 family protein [Streptomyces sp. NPDC057413]|uniref:DUF2277 family protein n=1 Tax=Streptomyces sp. NPDC057413 TaxID=3346124 RepID=UPI00369B877A
MCRSIKTLRPPVLPGEATEDDIRAAALQYVRKMFDRAVEQIATATAELLGDLEVRGAPARRAG